MECSPAREHRPGGRVRAPSLAGIVDKGGSAKGGGVYSSGGFSVGPRYGLAAGVSGTVTGTYRTGPGC